MRHYFNSFTVTGIGALLIAAFVGRYLTNIPFAPLRAGLGPAFFPTVVAVLIGTLGVLSVGVGVAQARKQPHKTDVQPLRWRSALLIAAVVLYSLGMQYVGLLVSTAVFLFVAMIALGVRLRHAALATAAASAAIYVVFDVMFRIRLF
ncbi:MAG: tripartite tricarboxylate transporter TctB family protein [Spirochaetaceae bacterium]|nr:MAG: tripartite tricarboxylate transporter TctB family protein [Spirochaetaceae bacterium]